MIWVSMGMAAWPVAIVEVIRLVITNRDSIVRITKSMLKKSPQSTAGFGEICCLARRLLAALQESEEAEKGEDASGV